MFYLISGGSGSGKSEYAENIAVMLHQEAVQTPFIYIATMMAFDEEADQKIARHRQMRKNKGFETIECFMHLKEKVLPKKCTVLLDCMSNLVANEMFQEEGAKENTTEAIIQGVDHVLAQCNHLVIVTNDIFSDGCEHDGITQKYLSHLGKINQRLATKADYVIEVVCGIPIYHKRRKGEK